MALNVAFLGHFSTAKGSRLFKDLVLTFRDQSMVRWYVLGGIGDIESFASIKRHVTSLGEYDRARLGEFIDQYNIGLFLLFSVWPETYSYTLSEAINHAVPFIATDVGALGARLRSYACGLLVPLETAVPSTILLLERILQNPALLDEERTKVIGARDRLVSQSGFLRNVDQLYSSLLTPSKP